MGHKKKDILKKKFTENLKADARANIGVPVPTLYNKHMVKAVRSDASSAPSFDKVKSSVYRALASDRPQNPKSAQDVDIKGEWTKTINGSNFLLIDKKEKEGRILVQKSGLFALYRNDVNVHRWIRRIAALPLVPVESIRAVFTYIQQNAPQIPQAMVIHEYLMKAWLGQMGNAAIDVEIWNHFLTESERTNNHVEGFHSKLNKRAGKPHLELYRFIELLKEIQEENEVTMIMLQTGSKEPPKMQIKYQKINEKLAALKRKLLNNNLTVYEYTDQVGYLLHLED